MNSREPYAVCEPDGDVAFFVDVAGVARRREPGIGGYSAGHPIDPRHLRYGGAYRDLLSGAQQIRLLDGTYAEHFRTADGTLLRHAGSDYHEGWTVMLTVEFEPDRRGVPRTGEAG